MTKQRRHKMAVFSLLEERPLNDYLINLINIPQYDLLRTAAIYGANASGKTKLFQRNT